MYIAFTPRNFLLASQSVTKKYLLWGNSLRARLHKSGQKLAQIHLTFPRDAGRKQASFELQQTVLQSATEFARFGIKLIALVKNSSVQEFVRTPRVNGV